MVAGAVVVNVAFLGLGSVFDYPDVLQQPGGAVLARFREHPVAVSALFLLMAAGAALLAPIAVGLSRLSQPQTLAARAARWLGVAAAVVQTVGLLRWPTAVPVLAGRAAQPALAADAIRTFETLGTVLGTIVGETLGYLFTAGWTVLTVLTRREPGRLLAAWGVTSAVLIVLGALVPLGVPGADLANFVGYVLWSLWLVAMAVVVWRREPGPSGDGGGRGRPGAVSRSAAGGRS